MQKLQDETYNTLEQGAIDIANLLPVFVPSKQQLRRMRQQTPVVGSTR